MTQKARSNANFARHVAKELSGGLEQQGTT
jgi:hypothetical protein